jgi:hypothetical protein
VPGRTAHRGSAIAGRGADRTSSALEGCAAPARTLVAIGAIEGAEVSPGHPNTRLIGTALRGSGARHAGRRTHWRGTSGGTPGASDAPPRSRATRPDLCSASRDDSSASDDNSAGASGAARRRLATDSNATAYPDGSSASNDHSAGAYHAPRSCPSASSNGTAYRDDSSHAGSSAPDSAGADSNVSAGRDRNSSPVSVHAPDTARSPHPGGRGGYAGVRDADQGIATVRGDGAGV